MNGLINCCGICKVGILLLIVGIELTSMFYFIILRPHTVILLLLYLYCIVLYFTGGGGGVTCPLISANVPLSHRVREGHGHWWILADISRHWWILVDISGY